MSVAGLLALLGFLLFTAGFAVVYRQGLWALEDFRHPAWLAFLAGAFLLGVAYFGLGVEPEEIFGA